MISVSTLRMEKRPVVLRTDSGASAALFQRLTECARRIHRLGRSDLIVRWEHVLLPVNMRDAGSGVSGVTQNDQQRASRLGGAKF